jgi:hypothetical protein
VDCSETEKSLFFYRDKVEVPLRSAQVRHCRTQSELGRIVPHPSHLRPPQADRLREAEKNAKDNAVSTPKHTVLSMVGLTSAVWTLGMFQMVAGECCQCIRRTKQTNS